MLNKIKNALQNESGFTLIEMMVVIVIIGILAAIALPTFSSMLDDAREAQSTSEARSVYSIAYMEWEKLERDSLPRIDDDTTDADNVIPGVASKAGVDADDVIIHKEDGELVVYYITGHSGYKYVKVTNGDIRLINEDDMGTNDTE